MKHKSIDFQTHELKVIFFQTHLRVPVPLKKTKSILYSSSAVKEKSV